MVITSNNINKANNHLSSYPNSLNRKKYHDIWRWKYRSWLWADTRMWRDLM